MFAVMFLDHRHPHTPAREASVEDSYTEALEAAANMANGAARSLRLDAQGIIVNGSTYTVSDGVSAVVEFFVAEVEA